MIWLLPVTWDDSADLLRWRNDPVTRVNSRETEEVSPEDHQAWMRACLAPGHPKGEVWVADVDGTSVGVIRVSIDSVISITVAPEHRGKGYSKMILRQVCEKYKDCRLDAEIRCDNAASRYIFEQCGFRLLEAGLEFLDYRREP